MRHQDRMIADFDDTSKGILFGELNYKSYTNVAKDTDYLCCF